MTTDKLIAEMDKSLQFPGVSNAWTMPIKARIDMLSTGIRTPVGIKVYGKDLAEIEKLARQIEAVVRTVPGTTSAFAERVIGGYYLNIDPDRAQLARYGLTIDDVQNMVAMALGADTVTTTVEGRERYAVSMRYPRDAAQRSAGDRDAGADPLGRGRNGAARRNRQGQPRARSGHHPHRERAARGVHLCRSARPRHRRLCGRRPEGGRDAGQVPARLLRELERAVRIHGARQGAAADRRPDHGAHHFPAALSQFPPRHGKPDRDAVGAVRRWSAGCG